MASRRTSPARGQGRGHGRGHGQSRSRARGHSHSGSHGRGRSRGGGHGRGHSRGGGSHLHRHWLESQSASHPEEPASIVYIVGEDDLIPEEPRRRFPVVNFQFTLMDLVNSLLQRTKHANHLLICPYNNHLLIRPHRNPQMLGTLPPTSAFASNDCSEPGELPVCPRVRVSHQGVGMVMGMGLGLGPSLNLSRPQAVASAHKFYHPTVDNAVEASWDPAEKAAIKQAQEAAEAQVQEPMVQIIDARTITQYQFDNWDKDFGYQEEKEGPERDLDPTDGSS